MTEAKQRNAQKWDCEKEIGEEVREILANGDGVSC
jgi:hypothetical protein